MNSMSPALYWTPAKHQHHEGMCRNEGLSSQPWMTSFLCRGPRGPERKKTRLCSFRSFLQSFTTLYLINLSLYLLQPLLSDVWLTFKPQWITLPVLRCFLCKAPVSAWRQHDLSLQFKCDCDQISSKQTELNFIHSFHEEWFVDLSWYSLLLRIIQLITTWVSFWKIFPCFVVLNKLICHWTKHTKWKSTAEFLGVYV